MTGSDPLSAQGAPSRLVVNAFDVAVEVLVEGDRADEVTERLPSLWEFCAPAADITAQATVLVTFDHDPRVQARAREAGRLTRDRRDDLLQVLTQRITVAAIEARAGQHLMLHACAVADPVTGATAAFVAPGGTGKTTFVRTHAPGRWYVTDETTVVRDDGTVLPYPKPLSVRRSPSSPFKDETAPSRLGLVAPTGPTRLAALCLLERSDHHVGPARVETLDTLDALMALVPQTSYLPEMTEPLQRLAALCESVGGVHRVTYQEAAQVAEVVDELLGGRA